jgi:acetylglutamate kinase
VITVVKAGGAAKDVGAKIAALVTAGRPVVVVHGAGPQISERCRAVGIEPRFVDGLRVTDAAVLAVVEQALNHQNAVLVSELEEAGVAAVSVLDALHGTPDCDRRLGLVGRVSSVETECIADVLGAGSVPVVRPLASGPRAPGRMIRGWMAGGGPAGDDGAAQHIHGVHLGRTRHRLQRQPDACQTPRGILSGALNVNADHAAAAVARALGAGELIFLSDVPGVLDGSGAVIRRISAGQAPALIAGGHVCGGMIPKLESGLEAIAHGVWRVWIGAETMVTA